MKLDSGSEQEEREKKYDRIKKIGPWYVRRNGIDREEEEEGGFTYKEFGRISTRLAAKVKDDNDDEKSSKRTNCILLFFFLLPIPN